ncbi:MAG: zinc ribbon domain-containing protein [Chloroflexi bacterium]|nr:zinc ribbon domain-containing protein [Chloroflexota bacterium]
MPTYAYRCRECGISFERFQHFSEEPLSTCPECGGHVQRVVQPVGIIFRGKGFYVTDNKSSSSTLPKPASEAVEATKEAVGNSKAEPSKPAESKASE